MEKNVVVSKGRGVTEGTGVTKETVVKKSKGMVVIHPTQNAMFTKAENAKSYQIFSTTFLRTFSRPTDQLHNK